MPDFEDIYTISRSIISLQNNLSKTTQLDSAFNKITQINNALDKLKSPFSSMSKEIIKYYQSPIIQNAQYFKQLSSVFSNLEVYQKNKKTFISDGIDNIPVKRTSDVIVLKKMFSDISFAECADFINYLSNYPLLSYLNKTGEKIYKTISEADKSPFKDIILFRVRKHERIKDRLYTDNEMFEAPFKIPKQWRFSSNGQNHLYTSTQLETAIKESDIQNTEIYTWIKIKLINELTLLDISNKKIPLFQYCHIESEDKTKSLNIEYLLPNYIADCAKHVGFNGIIYNSVTSANVVNYVFFNCGKRDFVILDRGSNTAFA